MLNLDRIPHGLNRGKRKLLVAAEVVKSVSDGSFTYTDFMALGEPLRTDVLEVLDGMESDTKTTVQSGEVLAQGTVRIVHVAEDGSIDLSVTERKRKPGTSQTYPEKVRKSFGNCADVPDFYPDRLARRLLHVHGWPIRQARDGSKAVGFYVEMRWLEREVNAGTAEADAVELYENIVKRPAYVKLAGSVPTGSPSVPVDPKTNTTKRGGGTTASAGA